MSGPGRTSRYALSHFKRLRKAQRLIRCAEHILLHFVHLRLRIRRRRVRACLRTADLTAAGLVTTKPTKPVFEADRITLEAITFGIAPRSGATIGMVEGWRGDDAEKNALCPPLSFTGIAADMLATVHSNFVGTFARGADRELSDWDNASRLNPSAAARENRDDPGVVAGRNRIVEHIGAAMENTARFA